MAATRSTASRLNRFFEWLIRRSFQVLRIGEPAVAHYIAHLLAEFARTQNLYRPASLFLELARRFEFYAGAVHYMKKAFFRERGPRDPFVDFAGQLEVLV